MNAKSNSIRILVDEDPDPITRLPHVLCAGEWDNPERPEWTEVFRLRRAREGRGVKAMVEVSGRAFMATNIAFPSADAGEFWETLASLLLWLCGLFTIGFCLLLS